VRWRAVKRVSTKLIGGNARFPYAILASAGKIAVFRENDECGNRYRGISKDER
jgi:hypothetical protein